MDPKSDGDKKPMQNQKKPIQQKKPMQNFTAEKWADKIAMFIDNFGFLSGFLAPQGALVVIAFLITPASSSNIFS